MIFINNLVKNQRFGAGFFMFTAKSDFCALFPKNVFCITNPVFRFIRPK